MDTLSDEGDNLGLISLLCALEGNAIHSNADRMMAIVSDRFMVRWFFFS
ncbi:MAG: hypothetical protein MJY86_03775 [Bacteroidales bacterium]|nr:hypothetical protein [Bacteroidales bacterium]